MATTTFPSFGAKTDATEVAKAFCSSVKGRTILITGVNKNGIGCATAAAFASQSPKTIIIAGRCPHKLEECLESLIEYPNVCFRQLQVDLSSQKSVRKAAAEVLLWTDVPTIDIVVNNAGVMLLPERTLSEDGIEMHLATNHIGHFLLTNLLMPRIIASAKISPAGATRIINVSSLASMVSGLRASDMNWTKPVSSLPDKEKPSLAAMKMAGLAVDDSMAYIPMGAYGSSKRANNLFTVGLNSRLCDKHGIASVVLHPGEVESDLQRHTDKEWIEKAHKAMKIVPKSAQQGAATTLVAALDPKLADVMKENYGLFLSDCRVFAKLPPHVVNSGDAEKLWQLSEEMVNEHFKW